MATNLTYSPAEATPATYVKPLITGAADKDTFVLTKDNAGEIVKANIKQSDSGVYSTRYAIADVKNIYSGTDVDPSLFGAVKRGKNLLIKVRHTGSRQENGVTVHYPIECGITFKYPVNVVNGEDLKLVLLEALDTFCQSNSESTAGHTDVSVALNKFMLGAFPR